MSRIDFEMTYPCFVPLRKDGSPFTFNAEGDDCIAIFTDDDLAQRFFESSKIPSTHWMRASVEHGQALGELLRRFDGAEDNAGRTISHVLIDPSKARARTYRISEFADHVEE